MPLDSTDVTTAASLPTLGSLLVTDQLYIVRPGGAAPLYIGPLSQIAAALLPFFNFTAGTGLTGGTVGSGGTVAIAATGVAPGTYTNANVTVNAEGQITAIANGEAGFLGGMCNDTTGTGLATDIVFEINGEGGPLPTGSAGSVHIDFACTVKKVTVTCDQTTNLIVDIWNAPTVIGSAPTDANSIVGSTPPTITGGINYQDAALVGWTTALPANSDLFYNVDSVTTATWATVTLSVQKTQ